MKIFRIRCSGDTLTIFTGMIFMNMSFLLAEISALDPDPNNRMAWNLSFMIASSIAEEEPGTEGSTFSTLDFIVNQHPSIGVIDLISNKKFGIWSHDHTRSGEFEIIKPLPQAYFLTHFTITC